MYECSNQILIWQKTTLKKRGEIDAIPDNAYKHIALCFVITYWSRLLLLNSVIIPIIDLWKCPVFHKSLSGK